MLFIPFGDTHEMASSHASTSTKTSTNAEFSNFPCISEEKAVSLQAEIIMHLDMDRITMIQTVGQPFHTTNIENGEFSYVRALSRSITGHKYLDIRFFDETSKVAVLIETKGRFRSADEDQLFDYVNLEKEYNKALNIIAILANTANDKIKVWMVRNAQEPELLSDTKLKTMGEYVDYFKPKNKNDKTTVLENTSTLNRKLHDNGIPENLRSQFVGTCLLALKNGLVYENLSTNQILVGIKEILGSLLENSIEKAVKLSILYDKVLQNQYVLAIEASNLRELLKYIQNNILPYINDSSHEGQDILSYFFTTFNKYVAKGDKNQAFTPNHIAHFMCRVADIYKTSKIFDPTCGSGTFLVQAMTMALQQCETEAEKQHVKEHQIFGIEYDEHVFGLSTTNMLIHGDGNSNIKQASCFTEKSWIQHAAPNVVLMNPPYNASKSQVPKEFADTWGSTSTDPSKGLHFVEFIANTVNNGKLLALLPMACAIGHSGLIGDIKQRLLQKHTLDAVFSLPTDIFYPGASAVACCMVFDLGKPHRDDKKTFFGYFKEDGFEKRKGVGRVDVKNKWEEIENTWLDLYEHRMSKAGLSVTKSVNHEDEWCAEAYMETDYLSLSNEDFIKTMQNYAAYLIQNDKLL